MKLTQRAKLHVRKRPAGTSAGLGAILVIVTKKLGVDLTVEEGALLAGGIGYLVSLFTPREHPV